MRLARHFDIHLWISHKPAELNSKFVYHKGSNPEYPLNLNVCVRRLFLWLQQNKS